MSALAHAFNQSLAFKHSFPARPVVLLAADKLPCAYQSMSCIRRSLHDAEMVLSCLICCAGGKLLPPDESSGCGHTGEAARAGGPAKGADRSLNLFARREEHCWVMRSACAVLHASRASCRMNGNRENPADSCGLLSCKAIAVRLQMLLHSCEVASGHSTKLFTYTAYQQRTVQVYHGLLDMSLSPCMLAKTRGEVLRASGLLPTSNTAAHIKR